MDNKIEIFEKNTKTIAVYVCGLSDLTLYTPTLTIKRKATDASTILSKTGVVSDPSTTYVFNLTPTDTSMAPMDYCYDITLEGSAGVHTLIRDRFTIKESVKL